MNMNHHFTEQDSIRITEKARNQITGEYDPEDDSERLMVCPHGRPQPFPLSWVYCVGLLMTGWGPLPLRSGPLCVQVLVT